MPRSWMGSSSAAESRRSSRPSTTSSWGWHTSSRRRRSRRLRARLDAARRRLAHHGEQRLHETLAAMRLAREKLDTIDGIAIVDKELVGRHGVVGHDPMRLVIDVRHTGRTGYEIADALRQV